MQFTDAQYTTMEWTTSTVSAFSFVADILLVSAMIYLKMLSNANNINSRLVFVLAASDALRGLSFFIGGHYRNSGEVTNMGLCTFQGVMSNIGNTINIVTVGLIALELQIVVLHGGLEASNDALDDASEQKPKEGEKEEEETVPRDMAAVFRNYMIFVFFFTVLMAVLPLAVPQNYYGYAGYNCWITKEDSLASAYRFVTLYGWLWMVMVYIIVVYVAVYWHIQSVQKKLGESMSEGSISNLEIRSNHQAMASFNSVARRLMAFPIILFLCWTPATINRIYNQTTDDSSFGLILSHKLGVNLTGLLNGLAYGCSNAMQNELKAAICGAEDSSSDAEDSDSDSDDDDAPVVVGLQGNASAQQENGDEASAMAMTPVEYGGAE
jgi:hypothetical protein